MLKQNTPVLQPKINFKKIKIQTKMTFILFLSRFFPSLLLAFWNQIYFYPVRTIKQSLFAGLKVAMIFVAGIVLVILKCCVSLKELELLHLRKLITILKILEKLLK